MTSLANHIKTSITQPLKWLAIVTVALLAYGGSASANSDLITIGTGGPAGVYFAAGNALCHMFHIDAEKEGMADRCAAANTNGSNENISRVIGGEFAFGVAQSDWQYHAMNGNAFWADNPQSDLRSVMSLHAEPFQVIVAPNAGIREWRDLAGKRVNIGNLGSGHRGTMEEMLKVSGWKLSTFAKATQMSSSEHARALCRDDIDAFVFSVGVPSKGVQFALDRCDAEILDLRSSPAQALVGDDRPFYSWTTISPAAYPQLARPVTTFGVRATLITSAAMSDDLVYRMTKAVFENFPLFRNRHEAFQELNMQEMIADGLSVPLHPGAEKYYKEKGWL